MRKKMLTALLAVVGTYAALCGLACASYRALLYPAPGGSPANDGDSVLDAPTKDGTTARALDLTEPGDDTVLVWFHGNGERAEDGKSLAREMRSKGYGSVLAEYRGYGVSRDRGSPTESGLYADAEAILDALQAKGWGPAKVVLVGYSLGSGVAAEMAARGRCRALVLIAPFTSIPEVAGRHAPFLPTRLIIGDKFDTLSKSPKIDVPATVIHGTADEVVPFDLGERVARTLPRATFVRLDGAHHADLWATHFESIMEAVAARSATPM